ncbi:MAG: hypothetical protein Q8O67_33705 [Deltaproteobacteria bacterium]|nr:hypothetical protein [Deltaproteobacteria bacterium]
MQQNTLGNVATGSSGVGGEPRTARAGSRTSGEGLAVRTTPRQAPRALKQTASAQLLRHNLTAPEKKTLKRIEVLRKALQAGVHDDGTPIDRDSLGSRIFDHLRIDRGLAGNVPADDYAVLAGRLVDDASLAVPAATLVGNYLRECGATERGLATPERVKQALQILNDALYDHDRADAPIPSAVRELKLEKRDGGLQIAAHLRVGAAESVALEALTTELHRAGFGDIVVRPAAAPLPAQKPAATLHSSR